MIEMVKLLFPSPCSANGQRLPREHGLNAEANPERTNSWRLSGTMLLGAAQNPFMKGDLKVHTSPRLPSGAHFYPPSRDRAQGSKLHFTFQALAYIIPANT